MREEIKALGSETAIEKFREVNMMKRESIKNRGVSHFLSSLTGKK